MLLKSKILRTLYPMRSIAKHTALFKSSICCASSMLRYAAHRISLLVKIGDFKSIGKFRRIKKEQQAPKEKFRRIGYHKRAKKKGPWGYNIGPFFFRPLMVSRRQTIKVTFRIYLVLCFAQALIIPQG